MKKKNNKKENNNINKCASLSLISYHGCIHFIRAPDILYQIEEADTVTHCRQQDEFLFLFSLPSCAL